MSKHPVLRETLVGDKDFVFLNLLFSRLFALKAFVFRGTFVLNESNAVMESAQKNRPEIRSNSGSGSTCSHFRKPGIYYSAAVSSIVALSICCSTKCALLCEGLSFSAYCMKREALW